MEISLVLSNDSGSFQALLGQFIETSALQVAADAAAAAASASDAAASQTAAAGAAMAAANFADGAAGSATAAAGSASAASASAGSASGSATTATTQATNAANSATASANSATAAAGSATAASGSATAAATSASNAAATLASSLLKANNLSDVASQSTALTNLLGASTIPIANGGTGAATQAAALSAILGTSSIPVANGGTGAATAVGARVNLGLGSAATQNTGTSGATVPLLSAANTWTLGQAFTVRPTFAGYTPWDSGNLDPTTFPTKANNLSDLASTVTARKNMGMARKLIGTYNAATAVTSLGSGTCFNDTECNVFEVELVGVQINQTTAGTNATANFYLQTSRDGGTTWDSTATVNNIQVYTTVGASGVTVSTGASEANVRCSAMGRSNTNYQLCGRFKFYQINVATPLQHFEADVMCTSQTLATQYAKNSGNLADGNVKTGIRLFMNPLTNTTGFTGEVRVYGLLKG
ncbi:hypothetical protein G3N59_10685 [Paraburkholderia sp. Ac-20340]|uniref:hypothetical protein n=1 Tax=Paraburkholderia sp. Ac-20340 TaxID=2703888 RepID=UPI001981AB2A|nr:hypothetical protein [Paraburkholderia sp. Ac-20340]MBN3853845.1 hypothetical protein [Paraburkholderia sp. Ac-20340]